MGYMTPARLETCGCGCRRDLHTGPTWPLANGACLMCDKGCKAFAPAAAPAAPTDSLDDPKPECDWYHPSNWRYCHHCGVALTKEG